MALSNDGTINIIGIFRWRVKPRNLVIPRLASLATNDINENRPSTPVLSEVEAHSSHKKRGIRLLGMTNVIYFKAEDNVFALTSR